MLFWADGPPRGKERARVCKNGHSFTPTPTKNAQKGVRAYYFHEARDWLSLKGAVGLFVRSIEAPRSKEAKKASFLSFWRLKTPDCDNIVKLVADALNPIKKKIDRKMVEKEPGAYEDDKQVVISICCKEWGERDTTGISVCDLTTAEGKAEMVKNLHWLIAKVEGQK